MLTWSGRSTTSSRRSSSTAVRALPQPARRVGRERRRSSCPTSSASCARVNRKIPGFFKEDPVETFRRHIWINPFWEDDVYEVVELMGADRVIFGSDWPHIEGMPNPLDYAMEIKEFDAGVAAPDPARQRRDAERAPAGLRRPRGGTLRTSGASRRSPVRHRPVTRAESRISAAPAAMRSMVASRSTRPSRDLEAHRRVVAAAHREALARDRARRRGRATPPAARRRRGWSQSFELGAGRERPEPGVGTGLGVGRDHVGGDAGLAALRRHRQGEADDAHLRHAVHRAAGHATERGARRRR